MLTGAMCHFISIAIHERQRIAVPPSPPPPLTATSNLALRKPAYSSSVYTRDGLNLKPDFAVDGITQYQSGIPIFHTGDGDYMLMFSVDLGAAAVISKVVLWNRCDCCSDRLQKAKLRIGNVSVAGLLETGNVTLNPLVWTQNATLGSCLALPIVFDTPMVGRWVSVSNGAALPLQLTEVEVFGYYLPPGMSTSEVPDYTCTLLHTEVSLNCMFLLNTCLDNACFDKVRTWQLDEWMWNGGAYQHRATKNCKHGSTTDIRHFTFQLHKGYNLSNGHSICRPM